MRTLAIGDIHGCHDALTTLVDFVKLTPEDRLITLGDYVDRGPRSRQVVDWLLDWQARGNLVPLIGNHEIMMITAREEPESASYWLACGGAETLESYAPKGEPPSLEHVPESHWDFFDETCLSWYETDLHIYVHAGLVPNLDLRDQPEIALFWDRFTNPPQHRSGKKFICGHTRQDSGVPNHEPHAVCIDTAACVGGWLTCLEAESGHYWQANEKGETREADL